MAIGLGAMNAAVALRKDVVDGIRDDILLRCRVSGAAL